MSSRDRARDKVERVTDGDHPDSQHPDSESGHHQRHHTPVPQMAMPTAQFSLLRAGLVADHGDAAVLRRRRPGNHTRLTGGSHRPGGVRGSTRRKAAGNGPVVLILS